MNAYIYQAALYCEDCGRAIRKRLRQEGKAPDDDSDNYPKGPFGDGGGESDCPEHCAAYDDCLNAIDLPDGRKIGAWLENPLTGDGVNYVREAIAAGGEATKLWGQWYANEL